MMLLIWPGTMHIVGGLSVIHPLMVKLSMFVREGNLGWWGDLGMVVGDKGC
jgi:hypothetical protein